MTKGIGYFLLLAGLFITVTCAVSEDTPPRQGKFGFLKGATTMLGTLAQDLVTRSGTSSQVLSLNLTNLFILLVLKAIVFGAGSFGYGPSTYGRSVDNSVNETQAGGSSIDWSEFLSESEILMMLSYMRGDATQDYGCLQRIVCEDPRKAEEYSFTGKLFLKGYEMLGGLPNSERYEKALSYIDEAIRVGLTGQNCLENYRCEIS